MEQSTLNNLELRVLVKGKPIVNYQHNGKNYVEGRAGSKFEIEVFNRNPFRVEAVISVDGLSVIDGKEAGTQSVGYLIEANSSVRIPGWKVNEATAASFEFTGKDGSYATGQTGSSQNNGVIGLMAFRDRNYRPVANFVPQIPISMGRPTFGWSGARGDVMSSAKYRGITAKTKSVVRGQPYNSNDVGLESSWKSSSASLGDWMSGEQERGGAITSYTADAVGSASLAAGTQSLNNLGTGFGAATQFKTETVQFDRGDLQAVFAVYYDNARGLKARGIEVGRASRVRHTATEPQAFPGMNCAVPAGWKG